MPLELHGRRMSVEKLHKEQQNIREAKPELVTNSESEEEIAVLTVKLSDDEYRLVKDKVDKRMLTEAQWQDQRIQIMIDRLSSCPDSEVSHAFKQDNQSARYD